MRGVLPSRQRPEGFKPSVPSLASCTVVTLGASADAPFFRLPRVLGDHADPPLATAAGACRSSWRAVSRPGRRRTSPSSDRRRPVPHAVPGEAYDIPGGVAYALRAGRRRATFADTFHGSERAASCRRRRARQRPAVACETTRARGAGVSAERLRVGDLAPSSTSASTGDSSSEASRDVARTPLRARAACRPRTAFRSA
jgi:hypothetical protein